MFQIPGIVLRDGAIVHDHLEIVVSIRVNEQARGGLDMSAVHCANAVTTIYIGSTYRLHGI